MNTFDNVGPQFDDVDPVFDDMDTDIQIKWLHQLEIYKSRLKFIYITQLRLC